MQNIESRNLIHGTINWIVTKFSMTNIFVHITFNIKFTIKKENLEYTLDIPFI